MLPCKKILASMILPGIFLGTVKRKKQSICIVVIHFLFNNLWVFSWFEKSEGTQTYDNLLKAKL